MVELLRGRGATYRVAMSKCTILLIVAISCQVVLVSAQYEALLAASLLGGQGSGSSPSSSSAGLFGGGAPSGMPMGLLQGLQTLGSGSSSSSGSKGKSNKMMSAFGLPSMVKSGMSSAGRMNAGSLMSSLPFPLSGGMGLMMLGGGKYYHLFHDFR